MLDIGWSEMAIVVVVALLVVGPKDLPKVLRAVRYWIGKARAMAREFQDGVDELVREAELKELKAEVEEATKDQLSGEFDDLVDPTGNLIGQPEDDVRTPGREPAAAEAAEAAEAKPTETKPTEAKPAEAQPDTAEAPASEKPRKETARRKTDGGEKAAGKVAPDGDGAGASQGAEAGPAEEAGQSTPAEPAPVESGAAPASGR